MSRGPGSRQRAILAALEKAPVLLDLKGATRSETSALVRAAKALEKAGKCVVIRLWNDEHTAVSSFAMRPDQTIDGKPAKELSVDAVSRGTRSTLNGSIRDMAHDEKVSRSTIWRILQQIEGKPRDRR